MAKADRRSEIPQGQDAYQRLIAQIRGGSLKPGDRLLETDLAARLGISRTPVREAIRRLEADGIVTHVPHAGAAIRRLDYAEVAELYEMRLVLEATAARFAARAASDVELQEMASLNAEMETAQGDGGRLYELNRQFHRVIFEASRNRYLGQSMRALQKTMLILGPSTMEESGRAAEAIAEHGELIEAFKMRDGEAAENAMRRHMTAAHRSRLRQLRERPTHEEGE
ncbi:GntR family transcriptional regulator [Aliihoeflea sp. PC F10.4]